VLLVCALVGYLIGNPVLGLLVGLVCVLLLHFGADIR
jgi:hypothetical protein